MIFRLFALAALACGATAARAADWDSAGNPLATRHLMVGQSKMRNGHFSEGIAQASRAIALSPDYGIAYLLRAEWLIEAGRYTEAAADNAKFAAMHPDARAIAFIPATIALRRGDGKAALENLGRAADLPYRTVERGFASVYANPSNGIFLADRSIAEALLGQADAAASDLQQSMSSQYDRPWYVLNWYCYNAAVAGQLELAELACDEAIKQATNDNGHFYDSLGFVHLKMHAWTKAIADYDKALASEPDLSVAFYGRGIARIASGDRVAGTADVKRATDEEPDIANIMGRLGAPTEATLLASGK